MCYFVILLFCYFVILLFVLVIGAMQHVMAQDGKTEVLRKSKEYQQFYNSGKLVDGEITVGALATNVELMKELDAKVAFLKRLYAEDAILLLPLSEPVVGIDDIINIQIESLGRFTDVHLETMRLDQKGEFAVEIGTYKSTAISPNDDGKNLPLAGTFMNVWSKGNDGEWKISASSSMGSSFKGPEYAYWSE